MRASFWVFSFMLIACRDQAKDASPRSPSEAVSSVVLSSDAVQANEGDGVFAKPISPGPSRESCPSSGQSYQIVGGDSTKLSPYVIQSSLRIVMEGKKLCTATLIGPHHGVTAAHCLSALKRPEDLRIGMGSEGLILDEIKVKAFTLHPKFRGVLADEKGYLEQAFYDVAIFSFEGKLPDSMKAIEIADPQDLTVQQPLVLAGYGAYTSDDKARRPLTQVESSLESILTNYSEILVTANANKGACFGDSGGPSYIIDNKSQCPLLIGSIMGPNRQTMGDCERGGATLTDLTRYRSWLTCAFQELKMPLEGVNAKLNPLVDCGSI